MHTNPPLFFCYLIFISFFCTDISAQNPIQGWPELVKKAEIVSSLDGTPQPSLTYAPNQKTNIPLLVALHTWSGDYKQKESAKFAQWCIENGWAFIHPNYRGPNKNPQSAGSEFVISDIKDAVNYMIETSAIDTNRIYLIGGSGGGYNALQVVAKMPDIWAGVSAWVPITDLNAWYYDNRKSGRHYADDIISATGGIPGSGVSIDQQYYERSPIHFLADSLHVPVDIAAGIYDGHQGSVPIRHSLLAFNKLAQPEDQLTTSEISFFVDSAKVPLHLHTVIYDPTYPNNKTPLFRRVSENVRITIFDGAHDTLYETGLTWLKHQEKGKKPTF